MNDLPARLKEIVEEFNECVGQEKLEYLLYFSENLPSLPKWLHDQRESMDEVHECMTPVFIYATSNDGKLTYYFDVPAESPTVRGFAAILSEGIRDLKPEEVLRIPSEFYLGMGLQNVLSGQRLNGLAAILAHMKQLAASHLPAGPDT